LVATIFGQPGTAVAADIFVGGMRWTGIPAIWIRGQIVPGDERTFAVVAAKRQASVVYILVAKAAKSMLQSPSAAWCASRRPAATLHPSAAQRARDPERVDTFVDPAASPQVAAAAALSEREAAELAK